MFYITTQQTRFALAASCLLFTTACKDFNAQAKNDAKINQGAQLYQERKFAEAVVLLESAVDQPSSTAPTLLYSIIGNCYNQLEEYEKAIGYHNRALTADPKNHQAYVNRGVTYRLMGEYDKAEASYNKALELNPNYPELHASLGSLAIHRGKHAQGVEHLERAIALQADLPVAHANLAVAYAGIGRFTDADQELQTAITQGYHNPTAIQTMIDQLKEAAGEK